MAKFTFDSSAFDEIENELNELADKATNFGEKEVSLEELFNNNFMSLHANSVSVTDFFSNSSIDLENIEDIGSISDDAFEEYVVVNTDFVSWDDMYSTAVDFYLDEQLGL